MLKYKKLNIVYAKELREDMTEQERKLWYNFLKKYPVRFQRQKAIDNFIADFYCASVEIDRNFKNACAYIDSTVKSLTEEKENNKASTYTTV